MRIATTLLTTLVLLAMTGCFPRGGAPDGGAEDFEEDQDESYRDDSDDEEPVDEERVDDSSLDGAVPAGDGGAALPEVDGAVSVNDEADASMPAPEPEIPAQRVVPIYLAASDTPDGTLPEHLAIFDATLRGVRDWYREKFDGDTFYLEDARALRSRYTQAQWDDFAARGFPTPDSVNTACAMNRAAMDELTTGGALSAHGLPPGDSKGVVYFVVTGGGDQGSCFYSGGIGAGEFAFLPSAWADCPTGRVTAGATTCRGAGFIAKQLGHSFGVPLEGQGGAECEWGPSVLADWERYDRGVEFCKDEFFTILESGFLAPR